MSADIERVFLRLASAATPKSLQSFVDDCLVKTISLFADAQQNEAIQKQIIELLTHFNKRVKSEPTIQLPVVKLLELCAAEQPAIIVNFAMIYVRMGYARCANEDRLGMLPAILTQLQTWARTQQNNIMLTVLPTLLSLSLEERSKWPSFSDVPPSTLNYLLEYLIDVILLPMGCTSDQNVPAGLSAEGFARVVPLTDLNTMKHHVVKFLSVSAPLYSEQQIIVPMLLALADTANLAQNTADLNIRRMPVSELLEESEVVRTVYSLYLGQSANQQLASNQRRSPIGLRHKIAIFRHLCRSKRAAAMFPQNIQVCFDALLMKPSNNKLQQHALDLLPAIVQRAPEQHVHVYMKAIFSTCRKFIAESKEDRLVCMAYQVLGQTGVRSANLVLSDAQLVEDTFQAVLNAPDEVSSSAADCVNDWLKVVDSQSASSSAVCAVLCSLAIQHVHEDRGRCQLLCVRVAERLFAVGDVHTRWVLTDMTGSRHTNVQVEANRILFAQLLSVREPCAFAQVVPYFYERMITVESNKKLKLKVPVPLCHTAVKYMRLLLLHAQGVVLDSEQVMGEYKELNEHTRHLQLHSPALGTVIEDSTLTMYIQLLHTTCLSTHDMHCCVLLVEAACHWPSVVWSVMGADMCWVHDRCMNSSQHELCALYAELSARLQPPSLDYVNKCFEAAKGDSTSVLATVGSAWSLGWQLALHSHTVQHTQLLHMETALLTLITVQASAQHSAQVQAVTGALSVYYSAHRSSLHPDNLLPVLEGVAEVAHCGRDLIPDKCRHAVIHLLGLIQVHSQYTQLHTKQMLALIMKCADEAPFRPELQLLVGAALTECALIMCSANRRCKWTQTDKQWTSAQPLADTEEYVEHLLKVVLNEKLQSKVPHVRRCAFTWLFVLSKGTCAWHSTTQKYAPQLQHAFTQALADANDLLQELASQGLGVLYEHASDEQQKQLVDVLVNSLTGSQTDVEKAKPSADAIVSPIFVDAKHANEPPSTYREMCKLAADISKPELVYKFMQIAGNQALWNSKAGAAFGFAQVLSQATEQIRPHLPQLIPKLYRYKYDPDTKVQQSMRNIWLLVTKEEKGVVDVYSMLILAELTRGLTDPQWRIRQSSCLALSDLLSAHNAVQMVESYAPLLSDVFRVQDDFKESVRLAADRAARSLQKVIVKWTHADKGAVASALLGQVLPVLLEQGLLSNVTAVKHTTIKCLMELSTHAGSALRPHLLLIIPALLEAISELEPAVLNYLAARSDEQTLERLDGARALAARSSPLMDAISECVRVLDAATLALLANKLAALLKASVGLATRTAVCALCTSLTATCAPLLLEQPNVADELVQALSTGLTDRNVTIRKQYAGTIGRLAKYAHNAQLIKILNRLINAFDANYEDLTSEVALAHALHGIAHNSSETLVEMGSVLAPCTLLCVCRYKALKPQLMDERQKELKDQWEYVWNELAPTTQSGVRLYSTELLLYGTRVLTESRAWASKADAARLLAVVCEHAGSALTLKQYEQIGECLIGALSGRIWNAKEHILQAMGALSQHCSEQLLGIDAHKRKEWIGVLLRECGKRAVPYKTQAIKATALYVQAVLDHTGAAQLMHIVLTLLNKSAMDTDESDSDDEHNKAQAHTDLQLLHIAGVQALAKMVTFAPSANLSQVKIVFETLTELLKSGAHWKVQQACVNAITHMCTNNDAIWATSQPSTEATSAGESLDCEELLVALADICVNGIQVALRKDTVNSIVALIGLINQYPTIFRSINLITDPNKSIIQSSLSSNQDLAKNNEQLLKLVNCLL